MLNRSPAARGHHSSFSEPAARKAAPFAGKGRVALRASPAALVENLEERRLMTVAYDIGINLNDASSAAVTPAVSTMKAMGVKTVRIWYSVNNWYNYAVDASLNRIDEYSNAGFDVTVIVNAKGGGNPGYNAVAGWFNWAANNSFLRQYINHWEVGNEPDQPEYWNGSLQSYVNDFLKPAYNALHAVGEEVISAGPSWNAYDVQTMIDAGMLNYCDYVGFHPYATGVDGVKNSVAAINRVVAGRKPIAATEWNVRGISDPYQWAEAVKAVFPTIKSGFALNYYFALKTQNSMAGPAGLLNSDWSANTPFYNAFSTFRYVGGTTGGGVTSPTPTPTWTPTPTPTPTPTWTPTPTPTATGNDAAGTGSVYGQLFDDSNANGGWDWGEKNSSGTFTVFLDNNANGMLDYGERTVRTDSSGNYGFAGLARGTYNVGAVLPNGFKLTNAVSTNVASGGKNTGVNLAVTRGNGVTAGGTVDGDTTTGGTTSGTPAVTGLTLLNAATGAVIGTYTKNQHIALSSLPTRNIAIAAAVAGTIAAVRMQGLGKTVTEYNAPYTLLGETGGALNSVYASAGTSTYGFTAYSGTGQQSSTFYVSLTFY